MARHLQIDLFTDFVCPWCLVGSARLDKAIAALPDDVTVSVANHPFYLDPNVPAEGVDVGEMLRARYGRDPKEMWARVEGEAAKSGIELDLSRQPRMYATRKAHTLVRLTPPEHQHALANAIAEAYFLDHRQIESDAVLADIAEAHGIDRAQALRAINDPAELATTEELARDAANQGINGVPFFILDGKFALSGAQPEEVFGQAFSEALKDKA